MKRILFCITIALLALLSCTRDEMPPKISYEFSDVRAFSDFTSCAVTCRNESVNGEGINARLLLSEREDLADATKFPMQVSGDTLSCNLTGLQRGTEYYYGFEMYTNTESYHVKGIYKFKTREGDEVTVTTFEITNITQTSADGGGNVTVNGDVSIQERGICWSLHHNPNHVQDSHATNGTGSGWFTVALTDLLPDTTYYVKAYARHSNAVTLGNEVSFKTLGSDQPIVITGQVTNITSTSATGHGTIVSEGTLPVTERGICWDTDHNPTIGHHHSSSGNGLGSFSCFMSGLTPNQTYYVRAYAITGQEVFYGEEVNFTALEGLPEVTTLEITDITTNSAKGKCKVTGQGGSTVTERGICWSNSHNPTTNGSHVASGTGTGDYSVEITGLQANSTYFAKAYATNSVGTVYGEELSFTTLQNVTLPMVTTSQVSNITKTAAIGGGNVTATGGAEVTERGICWSISHNPTTSSSHANNGMGTGSYTVNMSGLTTNTTYCVRAYAINSAGTAYGNEVNFTTSQIPSYTIGVSANPSTGGTVTGGGTYQQGQSCTVSATAATGYTFVRWTENGSQVSANVNYTFTVTGNRTLVAQFQAQSYTISASANPSNGGSVSGGGSYSYGQSCTIHATANNGYSFTNWTENGSVVSTNVNYSFTVNSNRVLIANFTTINYTITVLTNTSNSGSVLGGGTYQLGQTCTVSAIANSGFDFVKWVENGNTVSTNADYSFVVTGNRTLMAVFLSEYNFFCATAHPFCTDNGMYEFPAGVDAGSGEPGPDYDCLRTTPNPAWYYMRIGNPGDINIYMYSTPAVDIDFCCWGPFDDPTAPCPYGLTEDKVVSCSYRANPTENCLIPATAQTGEYYILVITNYSNLSCNISFSKVAGTGTTDCTIMSQ